MDTHELFAKTAELLRSARHVVIFTGAGISAESGIPTFRDKTNGLWSIYEAEKLANRAAFQTDPALVWGWYAWRRSIVRQAQPNKAHQAIAQISDRLPRVTVITQNVDDLLERAGCKNVIRLHGDINSAHCFTCGHRHSGKLAENPSPADTRLEPPQCSRCKGPVRPGVVFFGEALPAEDLKTAESAALDCDVLLSIGTSGVVYPAARLPHLASQEGAWTVHINTEPFRKAAERTLLGSASHWLPKLSHSLT